MKSKLSNKFLAILMSLILTFSVFAQGLLSVAADGPAIWDGSVATEYAGGTGEADDPYQIATPAQLAYLISTATDTSAGKYYILTDDIYLNDVSASEWYNQGGLNSWYDINSQFKGNFDGDGHTVYGLYYNGSNSHVGLFPRTNGTVSITNLNIKDVYIKTTATNAGVLVGYTYVSTLNISGCMIENAYVSANDAGGYVAYGGGIGTVINISNCSFVGDLDGATTRGAFISDVWQATLNISNSFAVGEVFCSRRVMAAVNCYGTEVETQDHGSGLIKVSAANMKGGTAKTTMPNLNWSTWKTVADSYPIVNLDPPAETGKVWDGSIATGYAGGTGSASDPYQIATAEQLAYLVKASYGSTSGKYFVLTADIYLNDVTEANWYESARNWYTRSDVRITSDYAFGGTLDGAGHTIYGLKYSAETSNTVHVGLFSSFWGNVTFENLTISDVYMNIVHPDGSTADSSAAAFAVVPAGGNYTFTNCIVKNADISIKGSTKAGASGFATYTSQNITIASCGFVGNIDAAISGAFLGNVWWENGKSQSISNSYSSGAVFSGKNGFSGSANYGTAADSKGSVEVVSAEDMKGDAAQAAMPNLGWYIWQTVENGYPVPVTGYAGGMGSKDDPYLISNAAQLSYLINSATATSAGKYYKLTNDIYLNDVSSDTWYNNSNNLNWYGIDSRFQGTFDGAGHTIYGLYYKGADGYVGLFPRLTGNVSITNLNISGVYIESTGTGAAAITGFAYGGTTANISNCAVMNAKISAANASGYLAYGVANTNINNCAFVGTLSATGKSGAFIGDIWYDGGFNNIKNVNNSYSVGARLGQSVFHSVSNCYATVTTDGGELITADNIIGEAAKTAMPDLGWYSWQTVENGYPVPTSGYADGTGTRVDPYLIKTASQLAYLAKDLTTEGFYYKLANDIYLNDVAADNWYENADNWYAAGQLATFGGTLDGAGNTIYGLKYTAEVNTNINVAMFRALNTAVFQNLNISDVYINLKDTSGANKDVEAAALVCQPAKSVSNESQALTFESCMVKDADITISGTNRGSAAGFITYSDIPVEISHCAFIGDITAERRYGAFLGDVWGYNITPTISNSYAVGEVFSSNWAFNSQYCYGTETEIKGTVTVVAADDMKGAAAKTNMPDLGWKGYWKTVEDDYPELAMVNPEGEPGKVWSGRIALDYAGGDGTEENPYLISTPEQLAKLVSNMNDRTGTNDSIDNYYKLTHDIYLNDVSKADWKNEATPWFYSTDLRSCNFRGIFDGDGHVVYGMYLDITTSTSAYAGLFPAISDASVVKNVGVSDAYMSIQKDGSNYEKYIGAIAGNVFLNNESTATKLPVISCCFGSTSVVLDSVFVGGIIGGAPHPANVDNCYFVGKLIYSDRRGGIIGNTWTDFKRIEATVKNCYSYTADDDVLAGGKSGSGNNATPIKYENNYANTNDLPFAVTRMSQLMARGEKAKENMKGFDFENVWAVLENGTPVLRIFGITDKFSNTSDPDPIEISFVTNSDSEINPIYGNPEEKLTLPTPEKEGYSFAGWYVFRELDIAFDIDYFPYFNQILYAKWTPKGLVQDFENYPDTWYDMSDDYEYYKTGVEGYNADYVRGGTKGIHRIGANADEQDFLILYEQQLEVGKEYSLVFYSKTDGQNANIAAKLAFKDAPDVYVKDVNVVDIGNIKLNSDGWTRTEVKFIAHAEYVALRTSGGVSAYFDDIFITLTGKTGAVVRDEDTSTDEPVTDDVVDTDTPVDDDSASDDKNDTTDNNSQQKDDKNDKDGVNVKTIIVIVVIAAVALIIIAIIILAILLKKKR